VDTQYNKQFIVSKVPLQPSGAKIKYEDLRGSVGNILINKLAFVLKQRQLHASQHYLSAEAVKQSPITDMFLTTAFAVLQFPEDHTVQGL